MAVRIEVATTVFDSRAAIRKKKFSYFSFAQKIHDVFLFDVYTIDKKFSKEELITLASAVANPVTQKFIIKSKGYKVKKDELPPFDFAIEIGFLPGVTDNVSHTVKEIASDLLQSTFMSGEDVYSSQVTFIKGDITRKQAEEIANSLYNPLIQSASIKSEQQFIKDGGMDIIIPKVSLKTRPSAIQVNLDVSDKELTIIGQKGIANADDSRRGPLALSLDFMKTIQKHFKDLGRNPTDIELESIAQTWSEHCKHTIFANPIDEVKDGLYKSYIKKATQEIRKNKGNKDFCVSVFTDNSGAIAFDKDYLVTHKAETHNSPSALDPFGGAVTGIVGVNRDALGFGLGAKPVANYYGFCFADPRIDIPLYRGKNKTQKLLSSKRIMEGVIEGVNAGGNQSGIPTPQGFIYFDERFRGKPLVFVGTVGLIPRNIHDHPSHIKKAEPGNYIVMVGGRVGKDGIHGATFSSQSLNSGSPATAVQIGDPITQKKMSDALVKEARDELLYTSITDNGAGGLSCSVAEMAKESGGCVVDLEKVPLKYAGLEPWEIWISESQERMTLAIPKNKWKLFHNLMQSRGVEATIIGEFTNSGKCMVRYNNKVIMDMDMDFLHNGLPKKQMTTKEFTVRPSKLKSKEPKDYNKTLLAMMERLNITSYSFISQQYDYVVQGNSVLPPLQGRGRINADTSVFRPTLYSEKGVILSQGLYPTYSDIDTYHMAAASIDTAIRNAVAAGANPDYLAILDNFCWTDSNNPERLYQLKQAARACYDYAVAYGTPFISGKDSMFNDFNGFNEQGKPIQISIPPTLLISSIGVIDDMTKMVSLDAKNSGDLVYILGETFDELGGSEYASFTKENKTSGSVPTVDAKKNKKVYDAYCSSIKKSLIASAQSIGRGGLAVALARKAMGGMLGMTINLQDVPGKFSRDDYALYSESQGRILVTVHPDNKKIFEKLLQGNIFACIGRVTQEKQIIVYNKKKKKIIDVSVDNLFRSYKKTFGDW